MIKNKLDFKLINLVLVMLVIFLVYITGNLWLGVLGKVISIIAPFFFGFIIAYAFYPILTFMQSKKIPKGIGITIIVACAIGIIALLTSQVVPLLFDQLSSLFTNIINFVKKISINYDLDLGNLQTTLTSAFNEIISNVGKYLSTGTINAINVSLSYASAIIVALALAVYLLIDMEKIRKNVKNYLKRKSQRAFNYVKIIDDEMKNYLVGFAKIAVISLFEYYFAYLIIGHPNALLLGFLAAIAGIIPYFGGMINNITACVTAFVISPKLFIGALIIAIILSILDSNVINPLIYGKTNKVHPIVVIISVFAGGILFGLIGIIISLPLALIIISTFKFFQEDIYDKIEDMKGEKNKQKELNKNEGN